MMYKLFKESMIKKVHFYLRGLPQFLLKRDQTNLIKSTKSILFFVMFDSTYVYSNFLLLLS